MYNNLTVDASSPSTDLAFNVDDRRWSGFTPNRSGFFFVPAYFPEDKLAGYTGDGGGMRKDHACGTVLIGAEIDKTDTPTQLAAYSRVADRIGELAMLVFSGGSSIHGYIRLDRELDLPREEALRVDLARAFCLAVKGDPAVTRVTQRMRYPGYASSDRRQPVIASSSNTHNPEGALRDLLDLLEIERDDLRVAYITYVAEMDYPDYVAKRAAAGKEPVSFDIFLGNKLRGRGAGSGRSATGARVGTSEASTVIIGDQEAEVQDAFWGYIEEAGCVPEGETFPCWCPFDPTHSARETAFVYDDRSGIECVHCHQRAFVNDISSYYRATRDLPNTVTHEKIEFVTVEGKQYLSPKQFTARMTGVRAPMGTGKTYALRAQIGEGQRLLMFAHSRAVVSELSNRVGVASYRDLPRGPRITTSCGVCINSLVDRIDLHSFIGATVVIDEASQMRRALRPGTMDDDAALAAMLALDTVMSNASRVILMDANLTEDDLLFFAGRAGIDAGEVVLRTGSLPDERKFVTYDRLASWEERLLASVEAGKRVAVASSAKKAANDLHDLIKDRFPALKVLLLTGVSVESDAIRPIFRDASRKKELFEGVDVLIYSPVLRSGYSIDADIWQCDEMYVRVMHGSVGVFDIDQMMGRVRVVSSQEYHVCALGGGNVVCGGFTVDDVLMRRGVLARAADLKFPPATKNSLKYLAGVRGGDAGYDRHLAWCVVDDYRCGVGGNRIYGPMRHFLHSLPCVTPITQVTKADSEDAVRRRANDLRRRKRAQRTPPWQLIVSADSISTAQAQELYQKGGRSPEYQRHTIATFMGGEQGVCALTAKAYIRGDLFDRGHLLRYVASDGGMQLARSADLRVTNRGLHDTRHQLQLDLVKRGFAVYGIENPLTDEPENDTDIVIRRLRELISDPSYCQLLHLSTGISFADKLAEPHSLLVSLGKRVMVSWKKKRVTKDGKRAWARSIDPDVVARLSGLVRK